MVDGPVVASGRRDRQIDPEDLASGVHVSLAQGHLVDVAVEEAHHHRPTGVDIVRVRHRVEGHPDKFLLAISEHLGQRRIHMLECALQVRDRHPDGGPINGELQSLCLGALALSDLLLLLHVRHIAQTDQ